MKKIIILVLAFTVLANCEVSPRKVEAQESLNQNQELTNRFYEGYYGHIYHEELHDDMRYGIWSAYGTSSRAAVTVVNLTKEALEVELLKLQITELANKNLNK